MELRVVNFETLTRNYSNYQLGIQNIDEEKNSFIKSLDPVKKEMESIISQVSTGLIVDEKTQREKEERFQILQQQAMEIDNNFKKEMKRLHEELNKKTYDELSEIITEYSTANGIDLVTGKMEVVFCNDNLDITENIISIFKERGFFYDTEVVETETTTEG